MGIDINARIDVSTLENRFYDIIRPGMRKNPILAMIMKRKRIDYSQGGKTACTWPMRYRRNTLQTHGDMEAISTSRVNRHKEAELPWRAYVMGELISKFEKLVQQGQKNRIFKLADEVMKGMAEDSMDDFQTKLYGDGNTTGSKDIHGFESIFSTSGTFTDTRLLTSNEVYANLTLTPGNYGGSWTGTYPDGKGDLRYHFATPCIVDYTAVGDSSGDYPTTADNWSNNWRYAMSLANTVQDTLHGKPADAWFCTATMLMEAKNSLIDKERINIDRDSEMTKLGFRTLNYEGSDITSAYACTAGACYGLVWDALKLKSMQDKLFKKADQTDVVEQTKEIVFDFWGNLQFNSPAYFCKLINET